ncbi:MAG: sugar phosphate isomerase/epimerase [Chloroflexia bacterium]|nr:sugar phosphate isomerase/epimerase [Chloroflexia bacterium]
MRRIHLKDYRRSGGFCPIGEGDVDWEAVGAALGGIGYDGTLTAEVTPNEEERADMDAYIAKIYKQVASVMQRMRTGAEKEAGID